MFKGLALLTIGLFLVMGTVALFRGDSKPPEVASKIVSVPIEIELEREVRIISPAPTPQPVVEDIVSTAYAAAEIPKELPSPMVQESIVAPKKATPWPRSSENLPSNNRIEELFNLEGRGKQLPIVETITYKSRVNWHKGSPAWISDYASYYNTSRHFIARSLNGKPDYFKQDIAEGKRFNVYRSDKNFEYYLLVDLSRCKLWLYYLDKNTQERVFLKDYDIGLGRFDETKISGLLTPLGKYTLGSRIAIYSPGIMGHHKGKKTEMIRLFGTRWIPFDKEISDTTEPAKGFGLHGVPWDNESGKLAEDTSSIRKYQSDGCIRMAAKDIEELYAILITKPATIELVDDYADAKLPGKGRE